MVVSFNKKYRGKTRLCLLEVRFDGHGRFMRLLEFSSRER